MDTNVKVVRVLQANLNEIVTVLKKGYTYTYS